MQHPLSNSPYTLDRSIDRFLYADGWRVTDVVRHPDNAGYAVTLTKTAGDGVGAHVTRSASSAGVATLLACSSARRIV